MHVSTHALDPRDGRRYHWPMGAVQLPEQHLIEDDGMIPNSRLPLLVYANVLPEGAAEIERLFEENGWSGCWRNGVFPYHHYHSTSHEVLGCYDGSATVLFGGPSGVTLEVRAGSAVAIPAGVGHKRIDASAGFAVVGAYPGGMSYDTCYGDRSERPAADERIARVPLPDTDPVYGAGGPLCEIWKCAAG